VHATRDQIPLLFGTDRAGIRGTDWGELRATVTSIPAGTDITPLLKGLPNNRCPCSHWGYVLTGEMRVTFANGEETVRAGDLFYLPPGHTVVVHHDVEYVEFSPPGAYDDFLEAVQRNIATIKAP
jgi:hypothetical protein